MNKRLPLLTLTMLILSSVILLIAGCAQQPFIEPTPIPTLAPATLPATTPTEAAAVEDIAPTAATEGGAAAEETPPADETDLVGAGAQVFEQTCAVCHNLTTETKVGPGLSGLFDKETLPNGNPVNDENLAEWITNGGGAMPAMPLTGDQLAAVVAFLKEATQQ